MKKIWLVTHGETQLQDSGGWCPDPEMTADVFRKLCHLGPRLLALLDHSLPSEIHCGTGKRQYQTALSLGLIFAQDRLFFSGLWGDASTLIKEDGTKKVLLGHGQIIEYDQYKTADHIGGEVIKNVIRSLPHNTVICSGRPVLVRLGMKPEECHSGALYCFEIEGEKFEIKLIEAGEILCKKD